MPVTIAARTSQGRIDIEIESARTSESWHSQDYSAEE
jgi:hypothetical protein